MRSRLQAAAVVLSVCLSPAALATPDTGSVFQRPVSSTNQLVSVARTDSAIASVYMEHFGMSRNDLLAYLRELHPAKLMQAGTYTVFAGSAGSKTETLGKGTRVFSDKLGKAVLEAASGNPITKISSSTSHAAGATPILSEGSLMPSLNVPVAEVMAPMAAPSVDTATAAVAADSAAEPVQASSAGGYSPNMATTIIGVGAAALLFASNQGGNHPHGEAVPEPAALLAVGLGAGALILRRRKTA